MMDMHFDMPIDWQLAIRKYFSYSDCMPKLASYSIMWLVDAVFGWNPHIGTTKCCIVCLVGGRKEKWEDLPLSISWFGRREGKKEGY
jgi:hypothetical protein